MANKLRTHGKNTIVWVLLGLIVIGLIGFSAHNFGSSTASIGSVGGTKISTNDYARALQQEQNAMQAQAGKPLSFQQFQMMGLDRRVQGQLFGEAAFENAAATLGISVSDQELADRITQIQAFQNAAGDFDRTAYEMALRNQGMKQREFEQKLRAEMARSIVQSAIASGVHAPDAEVNAYANYMAQTRTVSWAEVTRQDLAAALPTPSEDELKAWHDQHSDKFMSPETKQITYVWISPDMIADKVQVNEDALKKEYESRIDEFQQPERRLVERLVYPDMESAKAARAALDAGDKDFAALAQDRGLTLQDADMGDVTESDLGKAGKDVFAAAENSVVGPVETDLGPALFRVNGILAATNRSFDEVRSELGDEASHETARRQIAAERSKLEDDLAGGATLEDMAKDTDMQLGTLDYGPQSEGGLAGYAAFRQAAEAVQIDDFPEIVELEDGGLFALRLDGTTPAAVIPFDTSKDQVKADWEAAKLLEAKQARADEAVKAVTGKADTQLSATGLLTTDSPNLSRGSYLEDLSQVALAKAFTLKLNEAAKVTDGSKVYVVRPVLISQPDLSSDKNAKMVDSLRDQVSQSLANDMLDLYARTVQSEAGMQINSNAISGVNAQMR
ncbi:SurA N-terminal domain-containing protein [Thioclava sp. GXIMD4216]|uniref:SurA N-terminal domain-containing protein n=1 Tax=Thioclava sp. GXIMD4216 TaxID=3131929 RepID=UPI0030CB369F